MNYDRDLVIIGGGAAGMSAAQYGARANLSTLLIEEMAPGGQALIIEGLENYPGFPEPISGMELAERFETQARNFGASFVNASVQNIKKVGNGFAIETSDGVINARAVIIATGAKHRHLDVPGEKELSGKGVSYCATCDGPFFRNQRIVVVGGGDAACDEAMFLAKLTSKVTMIHRRDKFRAQKALAERVLKNPNITVRFNTRIAGIHPVKTPLGTEKVGAVTFENTETGFQTREEHDAVFVFVGSDPVIPKVEGLVLDEGGYIQTDTNMMTAVSGLFAAGDVRATPFRQLIVAASEGAIAAHAAAQYIDEMAEAGA